jgi:hypothetical protein
VTVYRLSFEVDSDRVDPSDLLDRLQEAVEEMFPDGDEDTFCDVDNDTVSVLTLDSKAIYLTLKIVPDTDPRVTLPKLSKESLARFFKNAGQRGHLTVKDYLRDGLGGGPLVEGPVIQFKSLTVQ